MKTNGAGSGYFVTIVCFGCGGCGAGGSGYLGAGRSRCCAVRLTLTPVQGFSLGPAALLLLLLEEEEDVEALAATPNPSTKEKTDGGTGAAGVARLLEKTLTFFASKPKELTSYA